MDIEAIKYGIVSLRKAWMVDKYKVEPLLRLLKEIQDIREEEIITKIIDQVDILSPITISDIIGINYA